MALLPQNTGATQTEIVRVAIKTHRVVAEKWRPEFHVITTRCGLKRERREVTSVSAFASISCEKCAALERGAVA